jgi:hypothetical protein
VGEFQRRRKKQCLCRAKIDFRGTALMPCGNLVERFPGRFAGRFAGRFTGRFGCEKCRTGRFGRFPPGDLLNVGKNLLVAI